MLERLSVENYALIDHLEMELDRELNIITGETGAGKSILLGALGLLLGGKNDGVATRDNAKSCVVEGLFSIGALGLEPLFEQMDWEYDAQVTIRRVITPAGKSRSFVGDIPASLSDLKVLSSKLIDIHSQHQNQILADESFRRSTLDMLYESTAILTEYGNLYDQLQELRTQLRTAEQSAAQASRDQEWIAHQVEELTAAKLREGESEEAEAELHILENAEMINEVLVRFTNAMDGDDERSVLVVLRNSEREMRQISKHYPAAGEYAERLSSALAELKDMSRSVAAEAESIESDPERLAKLSERIDTLYTLCQKHRAADLRELIAIRDHYTSQLGAIIGADELIAKLKKEIASHKEAATKLAAKITVQRKKAAVVLAKEVSTILSKLGMAESRFEVEIGATEELQPMGCDNVEMLFSSVASKAPQRIDRIASGGEVSRIMLALKCVIARHKELPTIIFDEIDTGVSGRIADAMGEIIASLAQTLQVVDITHLPQVASKGNSHFVVYKEGGHTNITRLTHDQRIEQIATMISGEAISDAAMEQARILVGQK
ncbi:MAG: DNA repair protein RecN [Rikenellaceae bacterium]